MKRTSCLGSATLAVALLFVGGCDRQDSTAASQTSYAPREPGSDISPTNELSFQLIANDGPTRFANFQALFGQSGRHCAAVTRAVLQAGLDGTDEWLVSCSDGAVWQVWFRPQQSPEFDKCAGGKCV